MNCRRDTKLFSLSIVALASLFVRADSPDVNELSSRTNNCLNRNNGSYGLINKVVNHGGTSE